MDIIEILQQHGVPFRTAAESKDVRDGWIGLHCPYCGRPDDKFYLGWNLSRRYASCWSCGWLPAPRTLAELTGLPISRCRELLGELNPDAGDDKNELRGKYAEPAGVTDMQPIHRNYLLKRGLQSRHVEKWWGVRGLGAFAALPWRLFIPIFYRDKPVSWTTRAIGDNVEPRYITAKPECEKISSRDLIYGGDMLRHAAIVVEGPVDCFAIGPGAAGLLGIGFSAAQVLKLSRIPKRLICFDNEPAAQLRARQLCEQLAPFPGQTFNAQIDGKDPASCKPSEIKKLRKFLE